MNTSAIVMIISMVFVWGGRLYPSYIYLNPEELDEVLEK